MIVQCLQVAPFGLKSLFQIPFVLGPFSRFSLSGAELGLEAFGQGDLILQVEAGVAALLVVVLVSGVGLSWLYQPL